MLLNRIKNNAALGVSVLLFATTVANADEPLLNGEAVGDWRFECVAVTEQQNRCALTQTIIMQEGAAPLARITVMRGEPSSEVLVTILTPLAVDLSQGTSMVIAEEILVFPFLTCVSEGCFARGSVDGETFRSLISKDEMRISYSPVAADGTTLIPASSRGLLEALDRASIGSVD